MAETRGERVDSLIPLIGIAAANWLVDVTDEWGVTIAEARQPEERAKNEDMRRRLDAL